MNVNSFQPHIQRKSKEPSPIIKIDRLTKKFNNTTSPALEGITVEIPRGEIISMPGPDGAGKTTLLRLIAGLLMPTSGTIEVAGYDTIKNPEELHQIIGYMPQKFGLYDDLTVMQNLTLYADLKGVVEPDREREFEKLLSFTALKPFTSRLAAALSGGMKQKLGLACAMLKKPMLLILDEPSVGVDPISRRELQGMLKELHREGMTIIWSTAYLDEMEIGQTTLLLKGGELLYYGAHQTLTDKMAGRIFKLTSLKSSKRAIMDKLLNCNHLLDVTVEGRDLRILFKRDCAPTLDEDYGVLMPIAPRFEDAYIDIFEKSSEGSSLLAKITPNMTSGSEVIIDAQELTKKFGTFTAAENISFKVQRGEIFGLLGPNGAGKSTIFKMLCGLLRPSEGNAFVIGLNLQHAPSAARQHLGYMAQKFSLYGDLSALENMNFFAGAYNLRGKERTKKIAQMIEIFALEPYLHETSRELPLGIKQRLALSCAVMHGPKVLFLDEPTSGVDPMTRREFWNHINGLSEKGVTIMVTTHFMDEAEYCDRIALIYRSKMITLGAPADLKEMASTQENRTPSFEDAFIKLIGEHEQREK